MQMHLIEGQWLKNERADSKAQREKLLRLQLESRRLLVRIFNLHLSGRFPSSKAKVGWES